MAWKCNMFFGQFSEPKLQDCSSKEEKRNRRGSPTYYAHIFTKQQGGNLYR